MENNWVVYIKKSYQEIKFSFGTDEEAATLFMVTAVGAYDKDGELELEVRLALEKVKEN